MNTETDAPPALFGHCQKVYEEMLNDATPHGGMIVYEGFLTQLVTGKLNLSVPYYTAIRSTLTSMGCIRQLRRGGSTTPSQWELIYEPDLEAFMNVQPKKERKANKYEQQQEVVDNLIARVNQLETWRDSVNELLASKFGME
jgi:hypothetical protein